MAQAEQGAWAAMRRLREEGAVGALGIGVNEVEVALESLERLQPDVILVAGRYTLLDRSAEQSGLIDACARAGALYVAAAPFNSGLLAGGSHFNYAPAAAPLAERARRMAEICRTHGFALAAAALQFPRRRGGVASVLAGAHSAEQVREQQKAMSAPLPEDLWAELDAA
jgi:D-threo-aldose 1-dehydrogenase